ncbi:ATP-binding cassette domain-containing protein [Lactobacillus taiwanensis]|uniref:ABC transporter n=1 Tax=Lactobacillus taiwanensis TaxID=508451 RepID=A0A256LBC0_9LACO|nr:ABC transporter ATP-binding protein [Lactobacillus taiwanensis]OYR87812.1 ABC transporter [Lactobacillus taiwanensis]OYR90738.1 ABC transporter [Lactobacillus taiwanensis]OYR92646.1 ABC transporter [Lactobacillus taiwanensis]OYR96287.1 ABC transporter [Lactobacillus taiwanensis]
MTFKGFINTNRLRFFFITILSVLSGISGILAGYIQMYWLTYIKENNWTEVVITTGLMALCWFFAQSVIYFVQYLNNIQEEEYFKKLRDQIAKHYFEDKKFHKVSDFQNRLTNDFEIVKNNFFEWYVIVPFYGSMLVASLIALISIHWSIFVLSVVIDIVSYFLPKLIDKKLEKATVKVSERNNEYLNTLSSWFSGLNELRRYFAGAKLLEVQTSSAKKLEKANVNQVVQQQLLTILNGVGELLSTIVLLGATGILVEHKVIIFGAILSVQNFANNVSFGMQTTIQGLTMMRSTKPLMAKISKDVKSISTQKSTAVEVPYTIETHNLALNFPNGETLRYPDLKINQGEKILLTGDSGSGKTTLFKLLLGLVEPSEGKIKFKNKNNDDIKPDFSKICYIPQEPNLFPGTIKQNITMFNNKLDNKVKKVVEEVRLDSDIKKFKNDVNTELDLNKLNISGGQRQKIVLARAKIHDSKIILIDEGTSAIDQKGTLNILKNLLQTEATIVFIAHNFNKNMRDLFDREINL